MPVTQSAALPHLRLSGMERPTLFIVRCAGGVLPAGIEPDSLTPHLSELRALFLLVSPISEPGQHLRLLGHLATHADDPAFLEDWMAAESRGDLRRTLLREERSITLHVERHLPTSIWIDRAVADIELPEESLVALIRRRGQGIIAHGDDVLLEGDHLTVIGDPEGIEELAERFGRAPV